VSKLTIIDDFPLCCVFVATLATCMTAAGCFTYTKGDYVGTETIEGTEVVTSWDYSFRRLVGPSKPNGIIRFKLERSPRYMVKTIAKYSEIRQPNKTVGLLIGASGVGIGLAGEKSNDQPVKTATAITGYAMIIGGIGIYLDGPRITKGYVEGDTGSVEGVGTPVPVPHASILAWCSLGTRTLQSNEIGEFDLCLVQDFRFTESIAEQLELGLSCENPSLDQLVFLNCSDWMVPYVQTDFDGGIYDSATVSSRRLFEYHHGETYRILNADNHDWVQIEFVTGRGWIPAQAGTKVWKLR
jgi:hypothetical protein